MSEMAFASVLKVYSGFSSVLCHNLSVLIHAIHHIGLAEDEIGFSR
jgi:hypothetical protein